MKKRGFQDLDLLQKLVSHWSIQIMSFLVGALLKVWIRLFQHGLETASRGLEDNICLVVSFLNDNVNRIDSIVVLLNDGYVEVWIPILAIKNNLLILFFPEIFLLLVHRWQWVVRAILWLGRPLRKKLVHQWQFFQLTEIQVFYFQHLLLIDVEMKLKFQWGPKSCQFFLHQSLHLGFTKVGM